VTRSRATIEVPDFRGMQALNAWLAGHDAGLLLAGPDPDSPEPVLNGIVVNQQPPPGARLGRWDVVTVWIRDGRGDGDGVREPRRPPPPTRTASGHADEPQP
jgi:beta-lactam-binding protein with PASTA domain